MEKYSPNWLLDKLNNSKTDAHKLMHIIEYRKEIVESTEKQLLIHSVVKPFVCVNHVYEDGYTDLNGIRTCVECDEPETN